MYFTFHFIVQALKSYHLINKTHKINLINFVLQYLLLYWSHFIKNNIIRYLASLLTISFLFSLSFIKHITEITKLLLSLVDYTLPSEVFPQ